MEQESHAVCVVADDDTDFLEQVCKTLVERGLFAEVKPFGHLASALAYIQTHAVALFVSDIVFGQEPLTSECLTRIPFTPVILMSTYCHYFMKSALDVSQNKNVIGFLPKFSVEMVCREIILARAVIKEEGLERAALLETAKICKITLSRPDLTTRKFSDVLYSEIVMVTSSRKPRGLAFHLNNSSKLYYLVQGQLESCYKELDQHCSGLFCLIPRTGIVNLRNVELSGNFLQANRSSFVHRLEIPSTFLPTLQKVMAGWSK